MKKILLILMLLVVTLNISYAKNATLDKQNQTPFHMLLTGNNKEKAIVYYKMAKEYSALKEHENAIYYFTQAIELDPYLIHAYIGRAKDCGDIGDYQCSLENYETLKNMYPNDPDSYWATSLYKTNTKDLKGAMSDIDMAISMKKKPDAAYYAQKAWVYLEMKDYHNAVKWAKKALKRDQKDEYTLGLITVMAYENGRFEDVLEITNECLKHGKVAKENTVLLLLRAKAFYYTEQKDKAIEQIENLIKIDSQNEEYVSIKNKMQKGEKLD